MAEESVVLRALRSYRTKIKRDFEAADHVLNGKHLERLIEIREEGFKILRSGKTDDASLSRVKALSREETEVKALFDRSVTMKATNRWVKLGLELEELNSAIAQQEFKERRR